MISLFCSFYVLSSRSFLEDSLSLLFYYINICFTSVFAVLFGVVIGGLFGGGLLGGVGALLGNLSLPGIVGSVGGVVVLLIGWAFASFILAVCATAAATLMIQLFNNGLAGGEITACPLP